MKKPFRQFKDHEEIASVDTLPKGRDAKQGSVRSKGSAVAESQTPNTPPVSQ